MCMCVCVCVYTYKKTHTLIKIEYLYHLKIVFMPLFSHSAEKAMAPHSSTLAWKIPRTEEPGRLQSMRLLRAGHDWATSLSLPCAGEGNGNPLQYSCLENLMDRGAWWATVHGITRVRHDLETKPPLPPPSPPYAHFHSQNAAF